MLNIFTKTILFLLLYVLMQKATAQNCASLTATAISYESRCAATGSIKVFASGGSGNYKYKAIGVITTNFTSSDSITGLPAGNFAIVVNDITNNCDFVLTNILVNGNYQDARFDLTKTDITCDNGNNGSIQVINQQFGRAPYQYTIIAPSPMGVGTSNSSGIFSNLIAGDYGIQMMDSCGGVQTRRIMLDNYTWWIDSYPFHKISCDSATGYVKVLDSKGNISTVNGIPNFMYGIIRNVGDTIWSAIPYFSFALNGVNTFQIIVKDNCNNIKLANTSLNLFPNIGNSILINNKTCNNFTASVNNITNFYSPSFCIYNNLNVLLACNNTGVFDSLPYGSYCIKAHDSCTDTTITRCFTQLPPLLSVGNTVLITNKTCTTFTATIVNQIGLTNPIYCIYDSTNIQINCNFTGQFLNLAYGTYCIKIKDGCRDTTITKCFTVHKPLPIIPTTIVPSYITCSSFGIGINGDSLFNPLYCLFNSSGVQIICNNTGVFDSLPFGNYCVNIYDSCYDSTFIRCFNVSMPSVTNDVNLITSNKRCSTFTLTANSNNLTNPLYCLYDTANVLISCNINGVFNDLPYGTYCLKSRNSCPDTIFTNCITVNRNVPSVNNNVSFNNLTCTTFDVQINGQNNLTTPTFYLYDSTNNVIDSNANGNFNNLLYGAYCIKIVNTCYDTIITRCFSKYPLPIHLTASSSVSCSYGYGYFIASVTNGVPPINVKIYRPNGNLLLERNSNTNSVYIDSIPPIAVGQFYKLIATDYCGNKDSINASVTASYFTHLINVINKCPSASATNGSGDIKVTAATNLGTINVVIISRNGVVYSPYIYPNSIVGNVHSFNNLTNATYVIRYKENYCNNYLYDTVTIHDYTFPNLNQSSAYQCDANGFSVGAVATGGVAPFTYEIIGSTPSLPSILTSTQTNPIFNINNGSTYSLIRLRAIDACGNGTLNDASIMPLSNTAIQASLNCYAGPTTLTVDTIYNASYVWYKKSNMNASDSTQIGTGYSYFIPSLSPLDTGIYVCAIVVNGGCIRRVNYIRIDGNCDLILPTILKQFNGQCTNNNIDLQWVTSQENNLKQFIIEKYVNNNFVQIGTELAIGNSGVDKSYSFKDNNPSDGANIYRLKLEHLNGTFVYSKIINIKNNVNDLFSIFPNPVESIINISFKNKKLKNIDLKIVDINGKILFSQHYSNILSNIKINKPLYLMSGLYTLQIKDRDTNTVYNDKIMVR